MPVNCGAIPSELMESELFGHKRGSFTGAVADSKGLVQSAEGGTLFLDEVADLPLHLQVKLLRVIQEKTVRPVGESRELTVDVRILSATHKDLAQLVAQGRFREDLYYRINVIELNVPPLRERAEDIADLAEAIIERLARRMRVDAPSLSGAALARLEAYAFPGNVRELENVLERAMTLCDHGVIGAGGRAAARRRAVSRRGRRGCRVGARRGLRGRRGARQPARRRRPRRPPAPPRQRPAAAPPRRARSAPSSRKSSAPRSCARWSRRATTRPPPPSCSA